MGLNRPRSNVLERTNVLVARDESADDDGGSDSGAGILAGEIDRLDGLDALELVDEERVVVHAAAVGTHEIERRSIPQNERR
eukprot:267698-Prymnesium_polylepis.1